MANEQQSRRTELHRRYNEIRAQQVAYYGTPYEGIFDKMAMAAVKDIIDYYEDVLNIAPISEKTTLQK